MIRATHDWRQAARERAAAQFRQAWERAPSGGRAALLDAAARGRVGHRWETGTRACVLALLVRPDLRPAETPKAAAYRLFGCEIADDFPVTWDAGGVTLDELLASVGVPVPLSADRRTRFGRPAATPVCAQGAG